MRDIDNFLSWYLGARTVIGRGVFNIVFFLASLPIFLMQLEGFTEKMSGTAAQGQGLSSLVGQVLGGAGQSSGMPMNIDAQQLLNNPQKLLQDLQQNRNNMQNIVHSGEQFLDGFSAPEKGGSSLDKYLSFAIYLLMIPVVRMRIRDGGYFYGAGHFVILMAAYAAPLLDMFSTLGFLSLDTMANVLAQVFSFFAFMWLCAKGTERRRAMKDRYLPGDSPDDPY